MNRGPLVFAPALAACMLAACSQAPSSTPLSPDATAQPAGLYQLTLDHVVQADGQILGLVADQQGGVWTLYAPAQLNDPNMPAPQYELVHWDPATRQRLATFEYPHDAFSGLTADGLALVGGALWLNLYDPYHPSDAKDVYVIDPATGLTLRHVTPPVGLATDIAAFGGDRVLFSTGTFDIAVATAFDAAGISVTADGTWAGDMYKHGNAGYVADVVDDAVATRSGEIWIKQTESGLGDPLRMQIYVFDTAMQPLGSLPFAFPGAPSFPDGNGGSQSMTFDRGELLVAFADQLAWFSVGR